jgi:hypothetical protein
VGRFAIPPTSTNPVLHVESVVQAKQPVAVVVMTYGSSSCIRPDGATVVMEGMLAIITPYDLRQQSGFCTADHVARPRPVELTFPAAGPATIRIEARDFHGQSAIVEQTILVVEPGQHWRVFTPVLER